MGKNVNNVISTIYDITIGEKVYKFKSLTLNGLAEFQEYCDAKRISKALDIYKLSGKEMDMDYIMSLKGDQDYYDTEMQQIKGMLHLIYIVIKNNNDNVDEEYVKKNLEISKLEDFANKILADFKEEKVEGEIVKNQTAKSQSAK